VITTGLSGTYGRVRRLAKEKFCLAREWFALARFEWDVRWLQLQLPFHPPGHPFQIWMLHPKGDEKRADGLLHLWQCEFHLIPDRHILYDLGFGWMFAIVCWVGFLDFWWGLASLIVICILAPIVTHVFLVQSRTLAELRASVSPSMRDWVESLPSHKVPVDPDHMDNALRKAWALARDMLIVRFFRRERWLRVLRQDPIYIQASGSPQGAFLALTLAHHFRPMPDDDASRGFLRFFAQYCAPIWSSYVWLMIVLVFHQNSPQSQVVMALGWASLSLWFMRSAVIRYGEWLDETNDAWLALRTLPYAPIWRAGLFPPTTLAVVRDRWVRIATTAITAFGLMAALTSLQVLNSNSQPSSTQNSSAVSAKK
jgi:hypothetical protein